jgi:hypothetical protein
MADAPKLSSATDASAAKYAPLSGLAISAMLTAVTFVVVLVVCAALAWSAGQPLLEGWLFAFPVVGIALAFIARRQVRNSEGARTGEGYANAAWWMCVVGGAIYLTYWIGTEVGVRSDAEQAMTTWADKFRGGNPTDPNDPAVREAYLKTLEPGQVGAFTANPKLLQLPQYAMPLARLRNSPLLLVSARNPGSTLVPQGLREWKVLPDGKVVCQVAGTLKCPEGEFPVVVVMEGTNTEKGRLWRMTANQTYCDPDRGARTRYGWLIATLDRDAQALCEQFVNVLQVFPPQYGQSAAVDGFISGRGNPAYVDDLLKTTEGRLMVVGGVGVSGGNPDPGAAFFARGNGQPMTDGEYDRPDGVKGTGGLALLRTVWADASGTKLAPAWWSKLTPEEARVRNTVIEVEPTADKQGIARVLFRVPVEFQPREGDFRTTPGTFASGKLVFVLDDRAVLDELAAARSAAAGEKPTREPPAEIPGRRYPLRLLRLESDLVPVAAPAPPSQQGGPGGPGGPPER